MLFNIPKIPKCFGNIRKFLALQKYLNFEFQFKKSSEVIK